MSRAIPWNVVAQPGTYSMRTEQKFLRVYHFLIATDHSRAMFRYEISGKHEIPLPTCSNAQLFDLFKTYLGMPSLPGRTILTVEFLSKSHMVARVHVDGAN